MSCGSMIQCRNRAPVVFTAEVRIFPRTGKSTAEETECEGHACWLQMLKSECPTDSLVEVQQWTRLSVWHHLQEPIWKKRVNLLQKDSWFLHHSSVPVHMALCIQKFLTKKQDSIVPQPTYISPANFTCSLNHKFV